MVRSDRVSGDYVRHMISLEFWRKHRSETAQLDSSSDGPHSCDDRLVALGSSNLLIIVHRAATTRGILELINVANIHLSGRYGRLGAAPEARHNIFLIGKVPWSPEVVRGNSIRTSGARLSVVVWCSTLPFHRRSGRNACTNRLVVQQCEKCGFWW